MTRRWVVDASPVISLARIGQVALLEQLTSKLIVPQEVFREIEKGGEADHARLWLRELEHKYIGRVETARSVGEWGLGRGESAVISYALVNPGFEAILDDAAGRTCAQTLGVKVRGTLGILLLAKEAGLLQRVGPALEALRGAGLWVDEALAHEVLKRAGEL